MRNLSVESENAHANETIRQLVLENDNLRQDQRRTVSTLSVRIHQLEDQNLSLQTENNKFKSQLEHSRQTHESFNKQTAEEIRGLKILLKNRENDNYNKDVLVATLDKQLASVISRCSEYERELNHMRVLCQGLQHAYNEQAQEIISQQQLSQELLTFIEDYSLENDAYVQQKALTLQYRQELQKQIQDVQNINEKFLQRIEQCRGVEKQLQLQNTQNNDFINLNERILAQLEGQLT